jgi:hypothetical protein
MNMREYLMALNEWNQLRTPWCLNESGLAGIDPDNAGFKLLCHSGASCRICTHYSRRKTIVAIIGKTKCFLFGVKRRN